MSDAIRIFSHSVTLIFRDFGATLRATSAGLLVLALALALFLIVMPGTFTTVFSPNASTEAFDIASNTSVLFVALVLMLFGLMMAVAAWHRYVLLPEDQRGGGFTPSARIVLGYFGRSILLGLCVGILAIPLMLPVGLVVAATGSPVMGSLVSLPINVVLGWVLLRLSLILPACAIGRNLSFRDSWAATGPYAMTILGLVVLLAALNFVITLIMAGLLPSNTLGGLVGIVVSLLYGLVSASVLTTLYGIAIEKRAI